MKKRDPIYDEQTTASATECTGLIPAAPEDHAQAENYAELYSIHEQTATKLTRKNRK